MRDPATAAAAAEALRGLIDAIEVFPGERRGEVTVRLRGDLAAFLHLGEASAVGGPNNKKAVLLVGRTAVLLAEKHWMRGHATDVPST